ncbi:NUDIX domain-containing protein [Candidatus Woesearchaeota archaeon]|nr:MAG: NUDIX domain-containing protein [Candidatus Woesearchaeota archaeon]
MADIHKIGAFVIRDKKVLVCRKAKDDFYISLGGKIEDGEDYETCLLREVQEETGCTATNIRYLTTCHGTVHGAENKTIKMDCYLCDLTAEPKINPNDHIVEHRWISREYQMQGIKVASLLEKHVIPELIKRDLI